MAFGRGRTTDDTSPEPMAPAPPPPAPSRSSDAGALTAFIDQGSTFEGKLSFKDTVRIDGHFSGEISSENTLIVGESGEIEATIRSKTVVVSGTVVGDVEATERLVVHKTGSLDGNVQTARLVVEDGAQLNGNLRMSPSSSPSSSSSSSSSSSARLQAVDDDAPKE
ncbi:MAG: polymer-forming cytoskeletal protein [Myxococcota bacterium]|nr:polymer-forming cytoskeletal protein [Myxococcota bacterium]